MPRNYFLIMDVDDISLLLSLDNDPDERIQMGLDEIREKHGLPVKDYE